MLLQKDWNSSNNYIAWASLILSDDLFLSVKSSFQFCHILNIVNFIF